MGPAEPDVFFVGVDVGNHKPVDGLFQGLALLGYGQVGLFRMLGGEPFGESLGLAYGLLQGVAPLCVCGV